MRKYCLMLFAVLLSCAAYAEQVSEQEALEKARKFMAGKQFVEKGGKARRLSPAAQGHTGYYVFNAETEGGFVIVAGDDRMPEILGYSEQGHLDLKTAPDNVKWLLSYYERAAGSLGGSTNPQVKRARKAAKPDIRPLMTTTWDQDSPYNGLCPDFGGQRCLTGCVATAMAQVINYNHWPVGLTGAVAEYVTASSAILLPALEPTQFDWDNMTNEDVARLMRYCGQSVQMDYGVNESGAFPVNEANALIQVFGYSQTAHYAEHQYYGDEDWEDLLYNELAEQRPIVYNGWGTGGGHTFVVHGYADGRFYINWGWSGQEDGYFLLTGLNTHIGDFNDTQSATIGIQPPVGNDVSRPKVVAKNIWYGGDKFRFRDDTGGFSGLYASCRVVSDVAEKATFDIGLGLYDGRELLKVLWEQRYEFPVGEEQEVGMDFLIGSDIPDGTYRIVPISRSDDSESWRMDANSSDYYLRATITGEYLRLQSCPLNEEERNTVDLDVQTIDGITYALYTIYGKNRAMVLPGENGSYSGDLSIPSSVSYNGTDFRVYKAAFSAFQNCMALTSLSADMPIWPTVSNCLELRRIEMREGVNSLESTIQNCPALESIDFPKSLTTIYNGASWCSGLKVMRFNNPDLLVFTAFPEWDENSLPALTDIYFMSSDVPAFSWKDGIMRVHPTATLHVLQGLKAAYEASDWKDWKIVDDITPPNADGVTWGYCEGNRVDGHSVTDNVGDNDAEYAIHVPADMLQAYVGKKISRIQYYQDQTECDYVFITRLGTDYLVKQAAEGGLKSWVSIDLPEPYTITGEELYVGIGAHSIIGATFTDMDASAPDGFWFRLMGEGNYNGVPAGEWACIAATASYNHPIALRFVITGDELPNDIWVKDASVKTLEKDKYQLQARVQNLSQETLKTYTLKWAIDGKDTGSQTIAANLMPNKAETVTVDITTVLEGRSHELVYSVSDVNNRLDAVAINSTGTLGFKTAANTFYPRRVVMEEATGTWCGWCVRGIESIERLMAEFPDNFIAIGLHSGDEMSDIAGYGQVTRQFSSYPSCLINRMELTDPAYPKVLPMVEAIKDQAEAKVSATAIYAKPDSSAVTVTTESIFGFSDDKTADFRLAFVVVEDHVGPYVQSNYYSGQPLDADSEFMREWVDIPAKVQLEFNDVARGLYGGANGVEGSLPTVIKEGEAYNYTYSFTLPQTIQDKKNIRIVALLVDNATSEIVNACQTNVAYDQSVEKQVFEFRNGDSGLLDNATVSYYAMTEGDGVASCGTNLNPNQEGLSVRLFEAREAEGTARLEIVSNTMYPDELTWSMDGITESLVGKTSLEKTFKTDADGKVPVLLTANNMKDYGVLEAKLTVTIGDQTQVVNIKLGYEKRVVGNVMLKDGQVWWYNHDPSNINGALGNGMAERYYAATYIPFNLLGGAGTTVDGFGFFLNAASASNVSVWISTKLPETDDKADLEYISIPDEQLSLYQFGQVAFKQPHEVPEEGLYVGYAFDITNSSDAFPIQYSNTEKNRKGAFWVKGEFSNPRWTDQSAAYGNMMCQVLFGGGQFVYHAARTKDFAPVYTLLDSQTEASLRVINDGADDIHNMTLQVTGKNGETYEVESNAYVEHFSEGIVFVDLKADSEEGIDEKTITITKVNGNPNTAQEGMSAKGRLYTMASTPAVTPVAEIVTATWDGAGIRGVVGLERLRKMYGNQVIPIAAHNNDALSIADYDFLVKRTTGYGGFVNRHREIDLYEGSSFTPFGIAKDVQNALEAAVPATIGVTAEWTDDGKTGLDIKTETKFVIDDKDQPFQIDYVLLEDGLVGWPQENGYSGSEMGDDPGYQYMASLPSSITDFQHNFVPVAAWKADKGVEGSIPSSVKAGELYTNTYNVSIAHVPNIQDKENLSVVVLLLDKQFGTIVNAARYQLGEGSAPNPGPTADTKTFEFRYGGKSLVDSETVTIEAAEDSWGFGEMNCETNPSNAPKNGLVLASLDGTSKDGIAQLVIRSNTLNAGMVQWCMGGECVPMNDKTSLSKTFTTGADGIVQVQFDANNVKTAGSLDARLTVTIGNESRTVNIKFVYDGPLAIDRLLQEEIPVDVYDVRGRKVRSCVTTLDGLPRGVYVVNGKKVVK